MSRFPMTDEMPCQPTNLRVGMYLIPSSFGNAEMEEAAARILIPIQDYGEWTGITWTEIISKAQAEHEAHTARMEARDRNAQSRADHESAIVRYRFLNIITLGIYGMFAAEPELEIVEEPEGDDPFTGLFVFGPRHLVTGIQRLIEKGFLRMEEIGEDQVLYPTPAMAQVLIDRGFVSA